QYTVAGYAAELLQEHSALCLGVVARLRDIDNPVDATPARPRPYGCPPYGCPPYGCPPYGGRRGGGRLRRCVNRPEVRRRYRWLSRRPCGRRRTAGGEHEHKGRDRNEHRAGSLRAPTLGAAGMLHPYLAAKRRRVTRGVS